MHWAIVVSLQIAMLAMAGSAAAKDGVIEILGTVQSMPASGLVGDWTIAGRPVRTDGATLIKQELGRIGVGATVEAKGVDGGGGVVSATVIEVKQGVPGSSPPIGGGDDRGEFTGPVESMPASGLVGNWRVAGRSVVVVATTRLQQELGGFRIGAIVEVHGLADVAGVVTASAVEVKSGGAATPVPPGSAAELEIVGVIDALPTTGQVGDWRVGGRLVRVTTATLLDAEHGAFAVGATVEVHGSTDALGALLATRIELHAGNGAPAPALRFWGAVEAMPATTTMPIGLWRIGGRLVSVSASTTIRQNDGLLGPGAIVEVSGWAQRDGVVLAHEMETRRAIGSVPGQAGAAIEFVNDRLGHYFLTAFPAEIAALDAGAHRGEWRRTGASFNVGGASAVCRFYGLPPKGPDSHFFTVDAAECGKVMRDYAAWTFEAHAFSITAPAAGACPGGLVAVTRFYNNPSVGADMNHRYVRSAQVAAEMRGRGWIDEGVVMCAQP